MDPDLVSPPGMDGAAHKRPGPAAIAIHNVIISHGLLSRRCGDDSHLLPVHGMSPDVVGNGSLVRRGNAIGNGEVFFPRFPTGKLGDERLVGEIAFRRDETARGVFVQTMHDAGSVGSGEDA